MHFELTADTVSTFRVSSMQLVTAVCSKSNQFIRAIKFVSRLYRRFLVGLAELTCVTGGCIEYRKYLELLIFLVFR